MARRFAAAFACRRRISAGSRASIWSSFMRARAAISAAFAANAARRSSTATGRTGRRRRNFRKTPRRNTASRWRCSTIRRRAGAALLRRQQGAVVRDHRRPAAIPDYPRSNPPAPARGRVRPPWRSGWGCAEQAPLRPGSHFPTCRALRG